jgi:O-antigen ligase
MDIPLALPPRFARVSGQIGGYSTWRLAVFASFAWTMSRSEDTSLFRNFATGISIGATLSMLVGIVAYVASSGSLLAVGGRLASVFPNPGWYAQYVCMSFPFVVYSLNEKTCHTCIVIFIAISAMVISLTMTRAAWIVFSIEVFCVILFMQYKDSSLTKAHRIHIFKTISISMLIISMSVLASYYYLSSGGKKTGDIELSWKIRDRFVHFSETQRLKIYKSGLLIGLESPFVGYGYESYAWRYSQFMHDPTSTLSRAIPKNAETFEATHNFYIQLFCGIGLLGLSLWLVLVGCVFRSSAALFRRGDAFAGAVILSAIAFHLFGIFQEMTYIPPIWLLMWVLLGYGLAVLDVPREKANRLSGSARGWLMAMICLSFIALSFWRKEPNVVTAPDFQGTFSPELVDARERTWSIGTSSFLLPGTGPREVEVGIPGLMSGTGTIVSFLGHDGRRLGVVSFPPGEVGPMRLHLKTGELELGERIYMHANRVYFPPIGKMADQRILGPYVTIDGF